MLNITGPMVCNFIKTGFHGREQSIGIEMLAQLDSLLALDVALVCFHDSTKLVSHGSLLVSYCYPYKKVKIANSLICQYKFRLIPIFFKMFTKAFLTDYAIASFHYPSGIAVWQPTSSESRPVITLRKTGVLAGQVN